VVDVATLDRVFAAGLVKPAVGGLVAEKSNDGVDKEGTGSDCVVKEDVVGG